ncbi:MAG: DUF2939 domain-containing protein [Desulfomonilaceae bacterium]
MDAYHITRKAKIVTAIIVVFFILTVIGLYSLPYITIYQIKKATEQNNAAKLAEYIDFKSVRQDLKEQIKTFLASRMGILQKNNPVIQLLGADLAERLEDKMVDKVIDSVVTPKGLDELMRGKIILGQIVGGDKKLEGPQPSDVSLHYESWSKFVADIKNQSDPSKKIKLILTRRGLEWKLTGIKLPLDTIRWPNLPGLGR